MNRTPEAHEFLVPSLLMLLAACGTPRIALDPVERERLRTEPGMRVVHYPPSTFMVDAGLISNAGAIAGLFGGAIGGLIGGTVDLSIANKEVRRLAQDCPLRDPAIQVADRVGAAISSRMRLPDIRYEPSPLADDDTARLPRPGWEGVVLDFKTESWGVGKFPWQLKNRCRVSCVVRGRLVRLRDQKILWQGVAEYENPDNKLAPTYKQLTEGTGAQLRAFLDEAVAKCSEQLLHQFFGDKS